MKYKITIANAAAPIFDSTPRALNIACSRKTSETTRTYPSLVGIPRSAREPFVVHLNGPCASRQVAHRERADHHARPCALRAPVPNEEMHECERHRNHRHQRQQLCEHQVRIQCREREDSAEQGPHGDQSIFEREQQPPALKKNVVETSDSERRDDELRIVVRPADVGKHQYRNDSQGDKYRPRQIDRAAPFQS